MTSNISAGDAGPDPASRRDPRDLGALRRSRSDRPIAGVAGGLARHLDVDPIIVRVALVVLIFFGGAGIVLYAGAWLLVPEEGTDHAVVRLDDRSRSFLLYVVGGIAALALVGDTVGNVHVPWGLLVIGLLAVAVVGASDRLRWRRSARRMSATPDDAVAPTVDLGTSGEPGTTDALETSGEPETTGAPATASRPVPPPADPRRRGPILFWFTLALILVAEGALGIADLAGATVAAPAYAALAVGAIGLMLVLGAFWGRAGGLILLGLLATLALVGSTAADAWDLDTHGRSVTYAPTTAAQVGPEYRMGTGSLRLDLSHLSDPAALGGRAVSVSGHVGHLEIIVPARLATSAHAVVKGPGQVQIFGQDEGGIHPRGTNAAAGDLSNQTFSVDATLNVGQITVETTDE